MAWQWDSSTATYVNGDTGGRLALDAMLEFSEQSRVAAGNAVTDMAKLTADAWHDAMREEIKDEYIRQYLLGRGGLEQMTQADWGSIGGLLAAQYVFLRAFRDEIQSGELSAEAIAARSRMYTSSAQQAFWRAYTRSVTATGLTEVHWRIDAAAENCPDCVDLQARGWMPIADLPTWPRAGATQCKTNCKCFLEYR